MFTELAEVDPSDPDYREETAYTLLSNETSDSMITTPLVPEREAKKIPPYIPGAAIGLFMICMVCAFTTLILILIIKKLQMKRKANVSNRLQNVYSADPTSPVYEIIQGNVHCANVNKVKNGTESDILNLVIDKNEHTSSLAIDNNRDSDSQYRTAVDEATLEIAASESFNLNNLHYENILQSHQLQHLHDTDHDTDHDHPNHPQHAQPASASSSISSYNDDFVYPNF